MSKKTGKSKVVGKTTPQALSDAEFVAAAIELQHRLSRHLDSLESNDIGAVSDVAAVLRTLLVRGDGDDVIRRLCKRTHVDLPKVLVTRTAHEGPEVILSAGAMPVTPGDEDLPHQIETRLVDLNRWSDMTALVVRGGIPHAINSWNRVIAMYANTFGSHLSGTIPDTLVRTSSIMSGTLDLGQYLIRCAGIVAENSLNQVLAVVTNQSIILPHKHGRKLNALSHLTLRDDESLEIALMGSDELPIGEETPFLKLHFADRYTKASYGRKPDGKVYGSIVFSQEKPDWWEAP